MPRERWFIGYLDEEQVATHLLLRRYTWCTTLFSHQPNMSRETAIRIARERGCPLPQERGGRLVWYPVWPHNVDGAPRRRGAGSSRETGLFTTREDDDDQ